MKKIIIFSLLLAMFVFGCGEDKVVNDDNNNPIGRLYVPNQADQTISIYNSHTLAHIKTFDTPVQEPHFVQFNHDYQYYYIIGRQVSGQVAKYLRSNDSLVKLITVEGSVFPTSLCLSPDDDTLYLTDFTNGPGHTHRYNSSGDNFVWLDSTLQAGIQTHDIRISPDGKYVVSAGYSSDDFTIIDLENGELLPTRLEDGQHIFNPISNNYGGYGVLFDATGERLFVGCSKGNDQIRVVDMATKNVVDSVMITVDNSGNADRSGPTYMAVTPDNKRLFVTNYLDNSVTAIDIENYTVLGKIEFSTPKPFGISIADNGSRLYVSCTNTRPANGMVYVIDPVNLISVDSITTGSEPFGLIYIPLN